MVSLATIDPKLFLSFIDVAYENEKKRLNKNILSINNIMKFNLI